MERVVKELERWQPEAQRLWERVPKKLLAVSSATALGYWADSKLLVSADVQDSWFYPFTAYYTRYYLRNQILVPDLFEESVDKWPMKDCIAFGDRRITFAEADVWMNRIAHWAIDSGLQPGQTVALMMENRLEYVMVWLGLAKAGIVTALINTHLQTDGLVHCLRISNASKVIVGVEMLESFAQAQDQLPNMECYVCGDGVTPFDASASNYTFAQSWDAQLAESKPSRVLRVHRKNIQTTDTALLIYTSGTTGLPKAARVTHASIQVRALSFYYDMRVTKSDRIYCPLPLYHTSGGNLSVGVMILSGATLCISRRFSVTSFWSEVRSYEASIIQYIGEMCRYLLNAPKDVKDKQNPVRAAFGNGLRPDVWAPFQERFNIPEVYEFYGSTEGHMGLLHACKSPDDQGHLGRRGALFSFLSGSAIVKYDVDGEKHIKDRRGFLQRCGHGETGELIIKLKTNDPIRDFRGYYGNEKASEEKVLKNVFANGDKYFRTGDLFCIDEDKKWHFVDRIGDTFRWKGENVATGEVSEALSSFPGLQDVCVYGVQVPGNDGRACMAAIVFDEEKFDLDKFAEYARAKLPSYAVPLFLRKLDEMSMTGTMKQEKAKLRKQGIDPSQIMDALWVLNFKTGTYERLTSENYHQLISSRL